MCSPAQAIMASAEIFQSVTSEVISAKQNAKTAKYRTQVALNNAQSAQAEALRQQQLGIDKAREEKIEGIRNASKQAAKASAGGFDLTSQTSVFGYEDTINEANSNASNIKQNYELQADSYFDKANSYLSEAKQYQSSYNASLFENATNALGKIGSVSNKWYEKWKKAEGGIEL